MIKPPRTRRRTAANGRSDGRKQEETKDAESEATGYLNRSSLHFLSLSAHPTK